MGGRAFVLAVPHGDERWSVARVDGDGALLGGLYDVRGADGRYGLVSVVDHGWAQVTTASGAARWWLDLGGPGGALDLR